jgi:hypothetical protein
MSKASERAEDLQKRIEEHYKKVKEYLGDKTK